MPVPHLRQAVRIPAADWPWQGPYYPTNGSEHGGNPAWQKSACPRSSRGRRLALLPPRRRASPHRLFPPVSGSGFWTLACSKDFSCKQTAWNLPRSCGLLNLGAGPVWHLNLLPASIRATRLGLSLAFCRYTPAASVAWASGGD